MTRDEIGRAALTALALMAIAALAACEEADAGRGGGEADADADGDGDADTDTAYDGPAIPETCEQAAAATTTVGCEFYAVHLDTAVPSMPYAVSVSNVNLTDPAQVVVFQADAAGWIEIGAATLQPMSLYSFALPELATEDSGLQQKRSFRIVSDIPIVAYQFNPVDGGASYLSDASMLIPVTSWSRTYDIVGWKQTADINGGADGTMRAYFVAVAESDGTVVTVTPSTAPMPGPGVPASTAPFDVSMQDGDALEVATANVGDTLTGSRILSNDGHPIAVFSGQECTYIPVDVLACDHLEEQLPGLRFWGKELVGARMPSRSTTGETDIVLWQIYASGDTEITIAADAGVVGAPAGTFPMAAGEVVEFYASGTAAAPGDLYISSSQAPIGVMQYMTSAANPNANGVGDPAMVYTSPTEQFLPRYVVLVPGTWINDVLVITRHAGVGAILDGAEVPDAEFAEVAGSGYEVARVVVADGVHTLSSADGSSGLGVIVVGWDGYDSYAYIGGMGMGALNPVIE